MKKGMKILFLLVDFFFLTKSYELVGDNKELRNIAIFKENSSHKITLYYYYEYPEDEGNHREYIVKLITPLTIRIGKEILNYHFDFANIYPRQILHHIFDDSTDEEIVGILNQRVHDMFKKWFGEAKVAEGLIYTPSSDYAAILYYKVHEERHKDLRFYSYEFEILSSETKSNYSIYSYGKDFSNNPLDLLTSLVEGMFGDRKGENESFEDNFNADSAYFEGIRSIIRENFNVTEDQMIFVLTYETLPERDRVRMFCKFKDADNSHIRLIVEFVPGCSCGYTFNNALMMLPKGREDITSTGFKHIITLMREMKE